MIAAVVITKNEQKNISRCLESIKWVDEIVVVDDYSIDKTVDICRKYTQNIFNNKFLGYAEQKRFAFLKARSDWILSVDADEKISVLLQKEILNVISKDCPGVKGYYISRKTYFLGKWMQYCGWYPDYQLRLFKNGSWTIKDVYLHESVEVFGEARYIKEPILHYSYSDIVSYIERMDKYTSLTASQMLKDNIKIPQGKIKRTAINKALKTFWKMYVRHVGFKAGMHGFLLSFFSAVYQLMAWARYWELTQDKALKA